MKRYFKSKNLGFTLIELLVSIAVLGIVLTLSLVIMTQLSKLWHEQFLERALQSNAQILFQSLSRDIQNSIKLDINPTETGELLLLSYTSHYNEGDISLIYYKLYTSLDSNDSLYTGIYRLEFSPKDTLNYLEKTDPNLKFLKQQTLVPQNLWTQNCTAFELVENKQALHLSYKIASNEGLELIKNLTFQRIHRLFQSPLPLLLLPFSSLKEVSAWILIAFFGIQSQNVQLSP